MHYVNSERQFKNPCYCMVLSKFFVTWAMAFKWRIRCCVYSWEQQGIFEFCTCQWHEWMNECVMLIHRSCISFIIVIYGWFCDILGVMMYEEGNYFEMFLKFCLCVCVCVCTHACAPCLFECDMIDCQSIIGLRNMTCFPQTDFMLLKMGEFHSMASAWYWSVPWCCMVWVRSAA